MCRPGHSIPGVQVRKQNTRPILLDHNRDRKTQTLLFTSTLDRFVSTARIIRQTIFFKVVVLFSIKFR